MELFKKIVNAGEQHHGLTLQPLQVQELSYWMRALVDENKFFIERVQILEGMVNGVSEEGVDTQEEEYESEAPTDVRDDTE